MMSSRNKNKRPLSKYKPKAKTSTKSTYGTFNRTPVIHVGNTELRGKTRVFSRVLKYQTYLATTGGQTFLTQNILTYIPYSKTDVVAGTPTITTGIPIGSAAAALFAAFQYYRVNRIQFNYTSIISTSVACPSMNVAYQPGGSATTVGGAPATGSISMLMNSAKFDPHGDFHFEYEIKRTSDISQVGGNELQGGWIPVAYGTSVPILTTSGVITTTCGDPSAPAPLTTSIGQYVVIYDISWLLGL